MRELGQVQLKILFFMVMECIFGILKVEVPMEGKIKIRKEKNFVELVCDNVASVNIKNGKEIVEFSMQDYLFSYVNSRLHLSDLKKSIILTCLVPIGCYNSVTDRKNVWALTGQKEGIYKNSYLCDKGKVYFGITDSLNETSLNGVVNFIEIYSSLKTHIPCEMVFEIFKMAKYSVTSSKEEENAFLKSVQKSIYDSLIIEKSSTKVKIYGKNIDEIF